MLKNVNWVFEGDFVGYLRRSARVDESCEIGRLWREEDSD